MSENNIVRANFVSGRVTAEGYYVGGVIGLAQYNNSIEGNLSTAWVEGSSNTGGIVAYDYSSSNTYQNNYWATDASGQLSSYRTNEDTSYIGLSLDKLRCATQANTTSDNSDCVSVDGSEEGLNNAATLFKDWETYGVKDGAGVFQPYWEFGSDQQLPGLRLNGTLYQDSDGDGVFDGDDAFILNHAAATDQDLDGYPDAWIKSCNAECRLDSGLELDQFPASNSAHLDADLDGFPDAWHDSCGDTCASDSGLTLDTHLNDSDNDGVLDVDDSDSNGIRNIDADSNGLVEIATLVKCHATSIGWGWFALNRWCGSGSIRLPRCYLRRCACAPLSWL